MRTAYRIEPFLSKLDLDRLLNLPELNIKPSEIEDIKHIIEDGMEEIKKFWLDNPDLRFGQMMFNLGFNVLEPLYHLEENQVLKKCGFSDSESIGWLSYLNEYGDMLPTPKYRYVSDLGTDHLKKMVDEGNNGERFYSIDILKIFSKELTERGVEGYELKDNLEEIHADARYKQLLEMLDLDSFKF